MAGSSQSQNMYFDIVSQIKLQIIPHQTPYPLQDQPIL